MAPPPLLHSLPSFSHAAAETDRPASDAGSDDDGSEAGFEFAFAPPLAGEGGGAQSDADDLFAHGRILPAYPVFDRALLRLPGDAAAPPSPDTYCAWAPRSAPGSPARPGHPAAPFPKSASTGESRRWRLRDLLAGRSHSDGKEKFLFLQPGHAAAPAAAPPKVSGKPAATEAKQSATRPSPPQKQSKKTGKAAGAGATEMDMATAHRLFYGKHPAAAAAAAAADRRQHSYLPYRPGIVGFFSAARALGRSHHPY
ncbi:hypothetical protein ACP4OV_009569 [Aristida adscensionis]